MKFKYYIVDWQGRAGFGKNRRWHSFHNRSGAEHCQEKSRQVWMLYPSLFAQGFLHMYHGGSGNASLGCAPSSNSPYGNDVPLWPVGELTGAIAFLSSTHFDTVLCLFLQRSGI